MKGIINILAILGLAFFAAGCAKEEASEFNERKDMIAVYLQPGLTVDQKKAILHRDPSLTFWVNPNRGRTYNIPEDERYGSDTFFLQSDKRITQVRMSALRDLEEVRYVSYMLEYKGQTVAVTDQILVKTTNGTEESRFADLVRRYGCTYRPWLSSGNDYIVTVPKTSPLGTIALSRKFRESDMVKYADPDFLFFMDDF